MTRRLAHGVGTRTDLPIPIGLALFGAGAAILLTFADPADLLAHAAAGRRRLGPAAPRGRAAGARQRGAAPRAAGRRRWPRPSSSSSVAFAGPGRHPAQPGALGLLRDLLGGAGAGQPAARARSGGWSTRCGCCTAALRLALPRRPGAARLPALGLWPAAVSLFAFLWLELVVAAPVRSGGRRRVPDRLRGRPARAGAVVRRGVVRRRRRLRGLLVADRPAVPVGPAGRRPAGAPQPAGRGDQHAGAARAGRRGRRPAGRPPRSTGCPGRCSGRAARAPPNDPVSGTLGMLAMIALVAAMYLLGTRLSGRLAGQPPGVQPRRYAATVIPIALGLHRRALLQPVRPRRSDHLDPGQQPVRHGRHRPVRHLPQRRRPDRGQRRPPSRSSRWAPSSSGTCWA